MGRINGPIARRMPGVPDEFGTMSRVIEPPGAPSRKLRGDIQGMRAVAVGLVVLGHAGFSWFRGGYIGVDVFFVISGFLITGILARSYQRTGRVSIADFYARRARRILPASALVLVAICIGSSLVYSTGRLHQVLGDTVWAAFFSANVHYASAGTGYFDNDTFVSPVQHFWSLAVEEQFYLVWPLLLIGCGLVALAVSRRRNAPAHLDVRVLGLRYGVIAIALLSIASVLWSAHRTGVAPTMAYFSTFTRAHELGAGALLALLSGSVARLTDATKAVLSWSGLLAIAVAATQYDGATRFPGTAALLPVLGAVAVLAGGIEGPRHGAALLLSTRPFRWIGDISYSLYLWHWPCLILSAAYLGHELSTPQRIVAIGVSVLAATLSYRYVEEPFRRNAVLDRGRLRALALWPVGLALVLGSVGTVWAEGAWRDSGHASYTLPAVDPEPQTKQTSADPLINDVGFAAELARADYPLPAQLRPSIENLAGDVTPLSGYRNSDPTCFADKPAITSHVCSTGDAGSTRTVVALGDSHMGMWLAPITQLAADRGMRVVPLLKQRCIPFDVLQWEGDLRHPYVECRKHETWTQQELRTLKPELIVVSALYLTDLVDPATGKIVSWERGTELFEAGARRTLTQLARLAPRVLVIGPTPVLLEAPLDCLGTRRATTAACRTPLEPEVPDRDAALARASKAAGVEYLRMLPWFCDAHLTCPVIVRDRVVYRDPTHISQTYAERLKPVFARALRLR